MALLMHNLSQFAAAAVVGVASVAVVVARPASAVACNNDDGTGEEKFGSSLYCNNFYNFFFKFQNSYIMYEIQTISTYD